MTCKLWDRIELDRPDVAMSDDGRRRLLAPEWNPDPPETLENR